MFSFECPVYLVKYVILTTLFPEENKLKFPEGIPEISRWRHICCYPMYQMLLWIIIEIKKGWCVGPVLNYTHISNGRGEWFNLDVVMYGHVVSSLHWFSCRRFSLFWFDSSTPLILMLMMSSRHFLSHPESSIYLKTTQFSMKMVLITRETMIYKRVKISVSKKVWRWGTKRRET